MMEGLELDEELLELDDAAEDDELDESFLDISQTPTFSHPLGMQALENSLHSPVVLFFAEVITWAHNLSLEEVSEGLELFVFEEALKDLLELFCEELGFFETNLATIIFDLLRVVWHWPSDTLSQPFHLSNL